MERNRVAAASSAIAESLGVQSVSVESAPGGAIVKLNCADSLRDALSLEWPDEQVNLRAIPMGRQDNGETWTLRLGPHTLVAGSSGSGKASMIWGLLTALGPAIQSNVVQVFGVDLKGGMELTLGRALLTRYATEPAEAVQLLEDAVGLMKDRSTDLAGKVREHTASSTSPHVLIVIDELAALTAYQQDRDLLRRANAALALLCSQGRAPGFTVFACLQDPRKETLPVRGLFTQTIGLRLRDAMETAMVLGEGMRDKGALCHQIPTDLPGVAYIVPETGGDPIRVRAGYAHDDLIRDIAAAYQAPHQVDTVIPVPQADEARPPRARRPRPANKSGEER